jgi:hypothetical protein
MERRITEKRTGKQTVEGGCPIWARKWGKPHTQITRGGVRPPWTTTDGHESPTIRKSASNGPKSHSGCTRKPQVRRVRGGIHPHFTYPRTPWHRHGFVARRTPQGLQRVGYRATSAVRAGPGHSHRVTYAVAAVAEVRGIEGRSSPSTLSRLHRAYPRGRSLPGILMASTHWKSTLEVLPRVKYRLSTLNHLANAGVLSFKPDLRALQAR